MLDKNGIAKRIAKEVKDGMYVNLGIGIPTLVANYIPEGVNVVLQSENGILGTGPFPFEGEEDADLINAGKQTVTLLKGASIFDSAMSFGMIVAMQHVNKAGESKLLPKCDLPLTGIKCVKKIVTELAVLDILPTGGFRLLERAPGVSVEQIKNATLGKLIIEGDIPEMIL
jgi:3-oxoacid CoA-transferase subunit B